VAYSSPFWVMISIAALNNFN
jgi:hypothetical protein